MKEGTIKEGQLQYMTSELRREMYKCNTLKNKHLKDRSNPVKWLLYRQHRNRVTSLRCKAIRIIFLSKCKPGATVKAFWYAVAPFISTKSKFHRNIILKEDENIITDTGKLCEIFAKFFSTVVNSIGRLIFCQQYMQSIRNIQVLKPFCKGFKIILTNLNLRM